MWDPDGFHQLDQDFLVTENADLFRKQVILSVWALTSADGVTTEINASQDTAFQVSWLVAGNRQEAETYYSETAARIRWNGMEWIELSTGPLTNECVWSNEGHFIRSWGPM